MIDPLPNPHPLTSEADKIKARKWFERGKAVADSRNYDYAIEAYVSGIKIWPEAIEEGHKVLRAVAVQRKMAGGKALGFLESRKHPTSGKDFTQNMLNAEFLWAHDPGNHPLMETMIANAARAGCAQAGAWMGSICADTLGNEKKVSASRYSALCDALDTLGEVAQKSDQYSVAHDAFNAMIRVATFWRSQYATSQEAGKAFNDAQSKLTIVKGRFGSSESFRDSIKDKNSQDDLRDKDRVIQADTRVDELTEKARKEYEADPNTLNKLNAYVDLLTRRERDDDENKAVAVLMTAHDQLRNFSLKVKAQDIQIKQMGRAARKLAAQLQAGAGDDVKAAARQHKKTQLAFEIAAFEERTREYPTDMKVRFRLGELYFKAKRFDEAIPLFQQAQSDGRHRDRARLFVGLCFFEKGLFNEAVGVLRQAFESHELGMSDDDGKKMNYWLARSLEAAAQKDAAKAIYGALIQIDYNYLDARKRLEDLRGGGVSPPPSAE